MIDVVNKLNASILIWGIDLPQQPITMWAEVMCSASLQGGGGGLFVQGFTLYQRSSKKKKKGLR